MRKCREFLLAAEGHNTVGVKGSVVEKDAKPFLLRSLSPVTIKSDRWLPAAR